MRRGERLCEVKETPHTENCVYSSLALEILQIPEPHYVKDIKERW